MRLWPLSSPAAASLLAHFVLRRLGDFDEAKHPRDDHGKFTDGGGGESDSGEKPKKEKAAPATKEQAKLAHEMKMAGHSYAAISKATGLNEKQAGMDAMSEKFKEMGNEVYVEADAVKESNKVL